MMYGLKPVPFTQGRTPDMSSAICGPTKVVPGPSKRTQRLPGDNRSPTLMEGHVFSIPAVWMRALAEDIVVLLRTGFSLSPSKQLLKGPGFSPAIQCADKRRL
jgi:hypothetical protein